jgi:hypothetical protein
VSGFHLVLGDFLGVLWRGLLLGDDSLVNLCFFSLEVLELRLLDSAVGDLNLAEHASLLRELFQGGSQVFDLG